MGTNVDRARADADVMRPETRSCRRLEYSPGDPGTLERASRRPKVKPSGSGPFSVHTQGRARKAKGVRTPAFDMGRSCRTLHVHRG